MRLFLRLSIASLCIALSCQFLRAQPITRAVPYHLPSRDTSGSAFLPKNEITPIDAKSTLTIGADGHIHTSDGTLLKFFGTELEWTSQFIAQEDAHVLAHHLRKLGFNAVRLVFNDYIYWDDASLVTYAGFAAGNSYTVNPTQLAKFDTLLYELRQAGIYVVLPLRSYHWFAPGEVPTVDSQASQSYLLQFLYPEAAGLEMKWARTLLGHVNPLTGIALGQDPAIAVIQLNWEESMNFWWRYKKLNYIDSNQVMNKGLGTISYHQSRRLDTLYAQFLRNEYGSDASLNAAWQGETNFAHPNLLRDGSFEQVDNAAWTLANTNGANAAASLFTPGKDSSYSELIRIGSLGPQKNFSDILYYNSYTAKCAKDSLYNLTFWARIHYNASSPVLLRGAYAIVSAPNGANMSSGLFLDTSWRQYSFTFRCTNPGVQYVGIEIGNQLGDIEIDAFDLHRAPELGLRPGESIENASVVRYSPDSSRELTQPRVRDQIMFMDSLERGFWNRFTKMLRDTMHVKALINYSQAAWWSTVLDAHPLTGSDIMDAHTGWDYARARGAGDFDSVWLVSNTPMVKDGSSYVFDISTLGTAKGKAAMVGFSVPFANQYNAEHAVMLPTYAAFQDWDGLFLTPYSVYREELFNDTIPGYPATKSFSALANNFSFMSLMPFASDMFLNKLLPASSRVDTIVHDPSDIWLAPYFSDYRGVLGVEGNLDPNIVTTEAVRMSYDDKVHKVAAEYPYVSDTSQKVSLDQHIIWDQTNGAFTVNAPKVNAFAGFAGTGIRTFGSSSLQRLDNSNDMLAYYYVPVGVADLSASDTSLLVLATRTQNTGMLWVDSMGWSKHWGKPPAIISAAKVQIGIFSTKKFVTILPLDSAGNPRGPAIAATPSGTANWFTATIDEQETASVWYGVVKADASSVASPISEISLSIYPNPATNFATLDLRKSSERAESVSILDPLGRLVQTLSVGNAAASQLRIPLNQLANGHYFVRVNYAGHVKFLDLTVLH